MTVSQSFLVFDDLDSFEDAGHLVCRMSPAWNMPDVSSWLDGVYGLWGEDHRGKVPFSSHINDTHTLGRT